ncbi:hypothetical protein FA13DRAFT_1525508 [Coprinellus micaceus]|uniref:MYND-type domain-containing protein n=1 Tax=Coprinellus micaceus TaxID=71717 RepID=A0A4Y7SJK6_COPMI|nr:hypothetical protein FA13DRAFT_1525508 [Coprinellus micaceus]
MTLVERIKSNPDPAVLQVWREFIDGLALYDKAYSNKDSVGLCDNLLHTQDFAVDRGRGVQCLWCHSVVYCSRQCQHDDWRVFHREECPNSRLNRIGTYALSL